MRTVVGSALGRRCPSTAATQSAMGSAFLTVPFHTACDDATPQVHTVLANAFKYTRRGGVTIETSTSADTSTVTLRVSDTGGHGFGRVVRAWVFTRQRLGLATDSHSHGPQDREVH